MADKDFRVTMILDYSVPEGTDEDQFHDDLRDRAEDGYLEFHDQPYKLDTVRDIEIEDLTEDE